MWDLYRVDVREVWSGASTPARVWGFVERLADEPWSRWRARAAGGDQHWREHLGWSVDTYVAAALVDAVQANTAVTAVAGSGRRPRRVKPLPRPTVVSRGSDDAELAALVAAGVVEGSEFLEDEEE